MICDKCVKKCMCATCVRNPYYVVNTPHPCIGADCDICDGGEEHVYMCNQYLSLEELNERVAEMQRANASYFNY